MNNQEVKFTLRSPMIEDKVSYSKHASNKKIWDNMEDWFPYPLTEDFAEGLIKQALRRRGPPNWFIIDVNGEAVGRIGLALKEDVHRKNGEIFYWLSEDFWGKGIMTKAIENFIQYAFEAFDIVRIQAFVYAKNLGSIKVLEKNGFKLEAVLKKAIFKNGALEDDHIYSLLKEDYLNKNKECISIGL